eukprot:m.255207 g.255207  ORF g.255207 m.255207 type:complete len:257 (+) comp22685_c4_seq1:751-1521(+)
MAFARADQQSRAPLGRKSIMSQAVTEEDRAYLEHYERQQQLTSLQEQDAVLADAVKELVARKEDLQARAEKIEQDITDLQQQYLDCLQGAREQGLMDSSEFEDALKSGHAPQQLQASLPKLLKTLDSDIEHTHKRVRKLERMPDRTDNSSAEAVEIPRENPKLEGLRNDILQLQARVQQSHGRHQSLLQRKQHCQDKLKKLQREEVKLTAQARPPVLSGVSDDVRMRSILHRTGLYIRRCKNLEAQAHLLRTLRVC